MRASCYGTDVLGGADILVCHVRRDRSGRQESLPRLARWRARGRVFLATMLMGLALGVKGDSPILADTMIGTVSEEYPPSLIRFYRVLAPEDRMKDWPLGKGKYLPVDAQEFERLASAMKSQTSETPPTPSAAIAAVQYEAKLVGERLIGRATLDVTLAAPTPAFLPFAPCNLAIEKAAWVSEISPFPKGEGPGVRADQWAGARDQGPGLVPRPSSLGPHPNPLPKGEGTAVDPPLPNGERTSDSNSAALGSGSDGRLGVFVERSGRLNIDWSLAGRRDSSDAVDFSMEIPAAPANRLFVELPNRCAPMVDHGMVLGSEPAGDGSRRWRIELGGHDCLRLRVVSARAAYPRRQLALLRESRTYDCSLRGVEVSAQWKLQVYNEPLERVSVLLDRELQLVSARLGDKAIPWSATPAANGAGTRVTLRLPEAIRDTDRVIRLSAVGRPVLDRPWRLPRIRAEGLLWQEGSISLQTPEPLATDRIVLHNCAQTGTGSLSAPRTGQTMQFQSFDRDATVEVLLSRCPARVETVEATAIELDGEEATAKVASQFRVTGETQFAIEADVAPRWIIDAVESVPAGGVADWSMEPGSDGRQRLMIRLRAAISPRCPVQLAITARRLFAPSPERLEAGDLPPIGFRGIAGSKRLVAVQTTGSYAMKLHGDARLKRFAPDDLAPAELALFAAKPGDLLFECNSRSSSLAISLVAREARYSGTIRVDASVGDRTLREEFVLRCVPQSGRVDRVLVRLFPRRDAPPRWTLSDSGAGVSPALAAGTAGPQDDRVSARRWSSKEDAAAGVDPSMETWELTLRRPRGDAFEISGSRETAASALPVVASLASMPEAADQRATVVIRSARAGGVCVENRRLKAVLPDPPPPGHEQTIRGAYRYDPGRDVAEGAKAAIRVCLSSKPAEPSAWIKNYRLESWHQTDGTSRHLATFELERSGCSSFRLAMPPGTTLADLHGVWIDGIAAAWQAVAKPLAAARESPTSKNSQESTFVSVSLPGHRKDLCVTVQWTAAAPALGIAGSLGAALPEPDLPVLARRWIAWLPPGYETSFSDPCQQVADDAAPDDMQGWTSRCVDIPPGTPAMLRYARVASMRLFAAVVFLLAAGVGCWMAKRRIAGEAVFAALLGVFGAAAIVLPSVYVPIALGGVFGVLFCLALRWIHRNSTPTQRPIRLGDPAANSNLGSTVAMTGPLGLVLLAALLTPLLCRSALGVDWPPRSMNWLESDREKAGTGAKPPRTTSGKAASDKAASAAASSPVYRVFVPVDAQRKPVGGKVYVPEAFYQELYRHAVAPAEKPRAWLMLGATYRGELAKEAVSGRLVIDALRAKYDLRVFDRAARVHIPLRTDGANLLPGSVLLDGRAIELEWEPNAAALAFEVAEPGDYRLELSLRPLMRGPAGSNGFDLAIPRVARARLELTVPADAPPVEVPSACGGVSLEKEPQRVSAELGPADRLTVLWQDAATAGGNRLAVDADQLTWLKIQPGSVLIAAKFNLRVADGRLRQVQLAVDPRLRLLPLPGDDPPTVQVVMESGQNRLITIRWPRPISDQTVLEATFLFNGASAVGNIRSPQIELLDVRSTRRWMAVSVDPALDSREQQGEGERLEALAVADFLKAWGPADSKPRAAYRLPTGESGWTLSTRPHEPSITADQTLALGFDEDRVDVFFDARLSVASGYVFQHRLTAPKGMKIERVSVMQEDVDRVQRWLQDDNGITVFLNGPVSGTERIAIRGQLPIRLGEKIELPTMRVEKCQIHSAIVQVYRRPAVLLSIEGGTAVPDTTKRGSELGRLVKTIAWDGSQPPSVAVTARSNRANGRTRQAAGPHGGGKSPNALPTGAEGHVAAPASRFVRLADVTLSRQADGAWCGAAAFDLEPGGAEELDLRLPGAGELVQVLVEDMPLETKRIGDGVWRIRLASPDVRQRVEVIFQGIVPETDRTGRLRFESPALASVSHPTGQVTDSVPLLRRSSAACDPLPGTACEQAVAHGNLPVRQTFWTLLLPPSWTAGEPDGATVVSDARLPLPRPKSAAGLGPAQTPRFYLSEEGEMWFTLDCHEVQSHRWPAATALLLLCMMSATVLTVRKSRKAAR